MKLKCIVVDDEQIAQSILKKYIDETPNMELVALCDNAMMAMDILQRNSEINLIFLDIEMPKISGLSFLKTLPNPPDTIITTAYREFAIEGFELNAIDYLLKPFSFERFLQAIQKVNKADLSSETSKQKTFTYFKLDRKMVKVEYSKLLYIEGLSNYIKLVLTNGNMTVYESLSTLSERLPSVTFKRVHKSYIVNTSKIDTYTKEYVVIDQKHIPLGASYKNDLMKFLKN